MEPDEEAGPAALGLVGRECSAPTGADGGAWRKVPTAAWCFGRCGEPAEPQPQLWWVVAAAARVRRCVGRWNGGMVVLSAAVVDMVEKADMRPMLLKPTTTLLGSQSESAGIFHAPANTHPLPQPTHFEHTLLPPHPQPPRAISAR